MSARNGSLPRSSGPTLPARYALVELDNLHDASLEFEPIHRVVFGAEPAQVLSALRMAYPDAREGRGRTCDPLPLQERQGASPSLTPPPSWRWEPFSPSWTGGWRAVRRQPGLYPRGRGSGRADPAAQGHRLPPAAHEKGGAVPHRDPRRSAAPKDLLHGGGPRQALLSGGPEDPAVNRWRCGRWNDLPPARS